MKLRRILCAALVISMLLATLPVFAAPSAGTLNNSDKVYYYQNSYDTPVDNANLGFTLTLTDDPDGSANKVQKFTAAEADGGADKGNSWLIGPLTSGYDTSTTYAKKGIGTYKKLYSSMDMYLPAGLLSELGTDASDEAQFINIGMGCYNGPWNYHTPLLKITKTADAATFTLTPTGGDAFTMAADTWFKVRLETVLGKNPTKLFVNDIEVASKNFDGWELAMFKDLETHICSGIQLSAKMPLETGFYVDNAALYQNADINYTLDVTNNEKDVPYNKTFTMTFPEGTAVTPGEFADKITAKAGDSTLTATVAQGSASNILTFTFGELNGLTEYTLNIPVVATALNSDIMYKGTTLTFTSSDAPRIEEKTYMYNYTMSTGARPPQLTSGWGTSSSTEKTEYVADLKSSDNTVLKYYTTDKTASYKNLCIRPKYGSAGGTYGKLNNPMDDTKTVFATAKIYISSESMTDMTTVFNTNSATQTGYDFGLTLNNTASSLDMLGAVRTLKTSDNKIELHAIHSNNVQKGSIIVEPDSWFELKWVFKPASGNIQQRADVYVNDQLLAKDVYRTWGSIHSGSLATGLRVVSRYTDKPIYIDDVTMWQMKNAIGIESVNQDPDNNKITVNFATNVTEASLSSIVVKNSEGTAVAGILNNPSLSVNCYSAVFDADFDALTVGDTYTLEIPKSFVDANGQVASAAVTYDFVIAKSNKDAKKYIMNFDMTANASSPTDFTSPAWLSDSVLERVNDPTNSSNKVLKYTSQGNTSQSDGARGYTSRKDLGLIGVWASTPTYGDKGFNDNQTLFASARFYFAQEDLANFAEGGKYTIGLGSSGTTDTYFQGPITVTKNTAGDKFVLTTTNSSLEVAPNKWIEMKWIHKPGSDTSKIYLDGEAFDLNARGTDWAFVKTTTTANGIRIMNTKNTSVAGLLVDDVKLWQMEKEIGIESAKVDITTNTLIVKYATRVVDIDELSKAVIKRLGAEVTGIISNPVIGEDEHTVTYDINLEALALATEYTIDIPAGYVDYNEQTSYVSKSCAFTTPATLTVGIKEGSLQVTDEGTSAPTLSFTLENPTINSVNAWVVIAAYDEFNAMLDAYVKGDITVPETGELAIDNVSFTQNLTDATAIRIYIWDSKTSMTPIQRNVLAWSK